MKKFFVYKCKLSLSLALLYLVELFINKLKTKFNNLFLKNDFKYKKNSQLLLEISPQELNKCLQKFYLLATVFELKIIINFSAQLSHCFSIY